jgi:cytochrome c553
VAPGTCFAQLASSAIVGALLVCTSAGGAESTKSAGKRAAPEDLRVLYATPAEVSEGRKLAESSCARCHGSDGVSTIKGVPHLAAQRPVYLVATLRAYQTGMRGDHAMENALRFLNDTGLVSVAAYYASLDPPVPPPDSGKVAPVSHDPLAAARTATGACAGCHGEAGVSKIPGTPSLVGLDPKYFVAAMNAYKNGQRKSDIMKSMAAPLGDADVKNIALFYALQKALRAPTPAAGDQAAGKSAAAACSGCHGENGVSSNPANPSLAGQDAQYIVSALKGYKDGSRKDETMKLAASSLGERAMNDMAAHYARQEPRAPKVEKPLTLAEWVGRCDRCHGPNGNSTDVRSPALAAQRIEYLHKVLSSYKAGERKNSVMAAMSSTLSDSDVEHLAAYYARQKARGVVFIAVPAK